MQVMLELDPLSQELILEDAKNALLKHYQKFKTTANILKKKSLTA